jgi:hypothetical protein
MLLELLRPLSFFAGMLSLYPVMLSAFFVPGSRWEDRLPVALVRIAIAACLCLTSGLLYAHPAHAIDEPAEPLLRTLPVRLFFCAIAGMALLFLVSWWLDTYYIPLTLQHGCCRP